jgi:hypothetical protein
MSTDVGGDLKDLGITSIWKWRPITVFCTCRRLPTSTVTIIRNAVRVETPDEAHIIDLRILSIWTGHSDRAVVPAMEDFLQKASGVSRPV